MRVAVLRGGPGDQYDHSLASGNEVLQYLRESKHKPLDIYIDKEGLWHKRGLTTKPHKVAPHADAFWNALHGEYGESGNLHDHVARYNIPIVGPDATTAALSLNKDLSKRVLQENGLRVPYHARVNRGDDIDEIINHVRKRGTKSYVVKPIRGGASQGVVKIDHLDMLKEAVDKVLKDRGDLLVEEEVNGREMKCGVIKGFRGERDYTLLPVETHKVGNEIIMPGNRDQRISTAKLTGSEMADVTDIARKAHGSLGDPHFSMVDIVLSEDGPTVLELDPLPLMVAGDHWDESLKGVGASKGEFIEHVLSTL